VTISRENNKNKETKTIILTFDNLCFLTLILKIEMIVSLRFTIDD